MAELTIPADVSALSDVAAFLEEVLENHVTLDLIISIQLVAEEAVMNIINHGYQEKSGDISIQCIIDANTIEIRFIDHANPFDITTLPQVNVQQTIDERKIGGLGVHLIRTLMDTISYQSTDQGNVLTLRKNIPESAHLIMKTDS